MNEYCFTLLYLFLPTILCYNYFLWRRINILKRELSKYAKNHFFILMAIKKMVMNELVSHTDVWLAVGLSR